MRLSQRLFSTALLATAALSAFAIMNTQAATTPDCQPSQYLNEDATECLNFTSPFAKASKDFSTPLDTGNTAWMIAAGALVMIMTPGVAFFYAGLAGEEMANNTMMMSFVSMALVTVQFWAFGYSASFGMEIFGWAGYRDVTGEVGGAYGAGIPNVLFAFFQTQFATITPALLSGGVVGRMKFGTFIVFILLWTSLVYDPLARWMWSYKITEDYAIAPLGWENNMGSLDFAGGTVIHVSSGFGALVAAIVVGKRYNHGESIKPHNVPLVMIGLTLLWFGWFGFNAGSATAANGIASIAAINTHIAPSAGFLTWMALDYVFYRRTDPCGAASGAVAGLVAITPACGFVLPWASVIFGVVGACVSFGAIHVKNKLRYDDTLDSFGLHGVAGFVGGLMTGLFATDQVNPSIKGGAFYGNPEQLLHQFISQCVAGGYSAVVTFLILMVLKYTMGLRVSEDKEIEGVDISYHGGAAYANGLSRGGNQSPNFKAANPPAGDFVAMMTPAPASPAPKASTEASNHV